MQEKIKNVIKRTFNLTDVPDDISRKNCVKWDSLNHVNLIVALEEEFDICIEPDDIALMISLKDIEIILNKISTH
jgi:acyl carrier protein